MSACLHPVAMRTRLGLFDVRIEAGGLRLAAHLLQEERRLRRRARMMPRPIRWEWARQRLVPLLAGPCFDQPGCEIVRSVGAPGCALEFGLDLGGVFALVDREVAERWECTSEQLRETALANLGARAARIPQSAVTSGTLSGRIVRFLRQPTGCASSMVLVPAELMRLFGGHDQVFGAPSRPLLVSVPFETPVHTIAEIVVELELDQPLPLMLDPFALVDGELAWGDGSDLEEGEADEV